MENLIQNNKVIQVLDYLFQKFGIAVDWTQENVMPYIQTLCEKYIRFEIATSITWIVVAVILGGVGGFAGIKQAKKLIEQGKDDSWSDAEIVGWILMIASYMWITPWIIVIICQTFDVVKCITFPEMRLMEYIQTLMRSGGSR